MLQEILSDTEKKLAATLKHLKSELASLRSGRATPAIIENISVSAYETNLPLKEVAAISVPDPSTLLVQPWDENIVKNIIKAIVESNLGLNPNVEGTLIRLRIPQLSEERRRKLQKNISQKVEAARVAVRNIRQEKIKAGDNLCDDGKISEDEHTRFKKQIQELVDHYNQQIDALRKLKEEEILVG